MVARTQLLLGLLLALLLEVGCAGTPIAFEEGAIPIEKAARVEGAEESTLGSMTRIKIERINELGEIHAWNSSKMYALLIPGEYEIRVRYVAIMTQIGLLPAAINAGDEKRNAYSRRRLLLSVEGGFTYFTTSATRRFDTSSVACQRRRATPARFGIHHGTRRSA